VTPGRQGTALLLVDLQRDFLARPGLVPAADAVCERAARLLRGFRARALPVAHAHTSTRADGTDRMPHWKARGVRACVEGTAGVAPPPALAPRPGEPVFRKRYFSAFGDPHLQPWLEERGIRHLVVAGVYLHGCVRSTVCDAYERGFEVTVADDAVGTTEPLHGEISRAYLADRAAAFRPTAAILADLGVGDAARAPACAGPADVAAATGAAAEAQRRWARVPAGARAACVERWADVLEARRAAFVDLVIREVGKPRRYAEEELGRAVAHARIAAELARGAAPTRIAAGVAAVERPVGVVGLLAPWNNPVAIPVGKIAPAVAFGNGVVLKPSPHAAETARALVASLDGVGLPDGLVGLVRGGAATARAICLAPEIGAVSLTGSLAAGRVVAALCAAAPKPLQAELGGNNAAVVLADADLEAVVPDLVRAAYGFAGQRCTAIRRFVVERAIAARFEALAVAAVRTLRVGSPDDPATEVGPLVSRAARARVRAAIDAARAAGARIVVGGDVPPGLGDGAWLAPTLVAGAPPASPIVQEETFGPVAVLQVAGDAREALALANGVPQGLVLAVHTRDTATRARLLADAEAGIVQLSAGPLAVHPRAPFVGWKASGLGPPEHGAWDATFYTRTQAVYGDVPC